MCLEIQEISILILPFQEIFLIVFPQNYVIFLFIPFYRIPSRKIENEKTI
jgi:hypothetical protein